MLGFSPAGVSFRGPCETVDSSRWPSSWQLSVVPSHGRLVRGFSGIGGDELIEVLLCLALAVGP